MSIKVDSSISSQETTISNVFQKLSETDTKIANFINTSKVIIILGLFFSLLFSSFYLPLYGLVYLSGYALALISTASLLTGLALIVNTAFFARAQHNKKALQNFLETSPQRIEEMPLGLQNRGNNCWANSMIQFMMNIPALKNESLA